MEQTPLPKNRQWKRLSVKIAAIYAVLGASWIFFSDKVAAMISSTPQVITQIQNLKGWFYVLVTAILLYCLVSRGTKNLEISRQELLQAKEDWERTFDAVPDLIVILDTDHRIVRANRAMAAKLGVSAGECAGLTCYQAVHGTSEPPPFCPHRQLLADGAEHTIEVHEDRLGGDFVVRVSPLLDPAGNLIGSVHTARDVTAHKQAERALRNSKDQYDTLVANIPVGVYLLRTTPTGGFSFEYVSPKMADILGLSVESLLSDPQIAFQPLHPDDSETFVRLNREHIEAKKPFVWEGRAVIGGTLKWLRVESQPETLENGDVLWHGIVADTSERQRLEEKSMASEKKYRDIFEHVPVGLFRASPEGRILDANPHAVRILGYDSLEEFMQSTTDLGTQVYANPKDRNEVIRILGEQGYVQNFEAEFVKKDGNAIWGSLSAKVVRDGEGNILYHEGTTQDITERKLLERALSDEHQKLSAMLDGSPISSFVIDAERRVTAWNMVNEYFTGISKKDVLGKPLDLSPLFKDKKQPSLAVLVLEMSDEKILRRFAHKGIWKSKIHPEAFESTGSIWIKGKEHVMAIQATRLRDAAGKVIGAIQCAEDITEQRRAEEALRESEELYRTALETSNDGVAIVQDGRYVYLNQRLLDTLGRNRDEMMGSMVGATMRPDDRATLLNYYDKYLKGLPIPNHLEVRVPKSDGSLIHAEVSPVEVTYKGKKSLLAYFRNITGRKLMEEALRQSEQKYRDVFNATSDALFIHDMTGCVLDVNEPTYAMFECDRAKALGLSFNDLSLGVSPYSETEAFEKIRRAIEEGPQLFEWLCRRSGGQVFWCEIALRAYGTGENMRAVASVRDISERKRAEEERLQLEQRLHQAQKAESLARMAGAIAHHFNNLLGAVMGNLELALNNAPPGWQAKRNLIQAMKASDQAVQIGRLMLAYLGQTVGERKLLDLAQTVREALVLLSALLPEKVRLRAAALPAEGPIILADSGQITMVLTNLVTNAMEAIGDQEGDVTLGVVVKPAGELRELRYFRRDWEPTAERYACLSVSDTGCGIEASVQERIVDPFFTTKFTGRGLGLAVVHGIVKAHEGAITLESQPGQGSIFRVFFPLPPKSPEERAGVDQ